MGQNLNFAAPADEVKVLLSSADQPSRASGLRTGSADATTIQRLKDVRRIAVASFGNTEAAGLVREKLINRLVASGRVSVVDDSADADAVLTGVVGADIYGKADTSAFRLSTRDGRVLWVGEKSPPHNAYYYGSASGSIAGWVAKKLLKDLEKN